MPGIYIHIPFCRKACHYCDFHFTTSLLRKNELVEVLLKEISLRKEYLDNKNIETIYFGGGTPSLLSPAETGKILEEINRHFNVSGEAELSFEVNPDDLDENVLSGWRASGINRLSIGVQSFFPEHLLWMNRAHDAREAREGVRLAAKHFSNFSLDLIYGLPGLDMTRWKENLDMAIDCGATHLSCYALTVEPRTMLYKKILQKKESAPDADVQADQFLEMTDRLEAAGFEHYEISNFARPGYRSRHNSSYWEGSHYLGLGPSAHSYNGVSRQWNIANNAIYIESIQKEEPAFEMETLSNKQRLNEYIMTSLRTSGGLQLQKTYPHDEEIKNSSQKFIEQGLLEIRNGYLILTRKGKLVADGIASDLFFI